MRGRTSRRPRLLPRASEGARRPDAARLKFAPSDPACPASLAVSRLDGPGRHGAGGGPRGPRAGAPRRWLPSEPSACFPSLPAASSPKRLWSWRVPCTVPLGKISRWKPVRQ